MITLQYITSTSFYVMIKSVARLSGVHNPWKNTNSAMEKWHYFVKYVEQSSLLPQTCLITKPCIHKKNILFVHIQNAVENIKQSQNLIAIITADTNKNHPRQPSIDVLFVRKHFKEPNIWKNTWRYMLRTFLLNAQYVERDLNGGLVIEFTWRQNILKKVLSDEFWMPRNFKIYFHFQNSKYYYLALIFQIQFIWLSKF